MLNKKLRAKCLSELKSEVEQYDFRHQGLQKAATYLHQQREAAGPEVIEPIEDFVNSMKNTPTEFEKSFSEFKGEYREFKKLVNELEKQHFGNDVKASGAAAAGVAAGVGAAALMPGAAMAIATTFGTASTGTAIASLSGAAATNAALAWLGGGAVVAGGGGTAAGSAFLALAGPIGVTISAVGLIGGALWLSAKNKEVAEEANKQRAAVVTNRKQIEAATTDAKNLTRQTKEHCNGLKGMLDLLQRTAPKNYNKYTKAQKETLAAMINHIKSLSMLINKTVE